MAAARAYPDNFDDRYTENFERYLFYDKPQERIYDFTLACCIITVSLALISQFMGILTGRSRLAAGQMDPETGVKSPLDTKIFLWFMKAVMLIPCTPGVSNEFVEHIVAVHRHQTENNVSILLILFANWIALARCAETGHDCHWQGVFAYVVAYVYFALRIAHFFCHLLNIRQPYRAIFYLLSNCCLILQVAAMGTALNLTSLYFLDLGYTGQGAYTTASPAAAG